VNIVPHVKTLPVPSDIYYEPVRKILHSILEVVQANYGAVSLLSAENGSLQSYLYQGRLSSQRADSCGTHWVATHGRPLAFDTQEEALLVPDLVINKSEALPLICVPIQVRGTTLGTLQANFPSVAEREELPRKQHILELAAGLIGHVIENAVLQRNLKETKELVRKVNNISLEIQEAERERIILELHDGIAQTLASAFQYLQTTNNIEAFRKGQSRQHFVKAVGLVKQAIQETRGIINSVAPATLDTLGLVLTLQGELKRFEKETGCAVDFRLATWSSLPRHMEFAIYRIIHEAVNNVRKHAKSSRLQVELSQEEKQLMIRVKDWGIGFVPDKQEPSSSNRSMGLWGMRRRAEFLGGTFEVNSSLGKGTEILVDIPWLASEE